MRQQKMYIKISEDGFMIEPVLVDIVDEEGKEVNIPPLHVLPYSEEKRFFTPRYDFEAKEWVEGLSEEEVLEKLAAIESEQQEQQSAPSVKDLETEVAELQKMINYLLLGSMSL